MSGSILIKVFEFSIRDRVELKYQAIFPISPDLENATLLNHWLILDCRRLITTHFWPKLDGNCKVEAWHTRVTSCPSLRISSMLLVVVTPYAFTVGKLLSRK
jgi:hypothetical protein